MLGWEYPPHITGGLGTACEGLTRALARLKVSVDFVVPTLIGDEQAPHMNLIGSEDVILQMSDRIHAQAALGDLVETHRIPAVLAPYWSEEEFHRYIESLQRAGIYGEALHALLPPGLETPDVLSTVAPTTTERPPTKVERYGGSMFQEVAHFASNVMALMARGKFDIIHAHDWMTFPAAVALKQATGKPLIVHVHSLEFDRSGVGGNSAIKEIEGLGVHAADAVVAVSYYTRELINREHGVPLDKISVVHNGVYPKEAIEQYRHEKPLTRKMVLFLGRVTFQKGPDYFVEAAARVIPHVPDVVFVMAGAGDMLPGIIERVRELGIEKHFEFTGFLKGKEVERMFSLADLYVMPSVSEPFGITALEAISQETPVILSRQSGVSEVLNHALKVDFWDVERMADLIINGLLHDELRADMIRMAREEVKKVRWDAAAIKTEALYQTFL